MKNFLFGITIFILLLVGIYYIDERNGVHDAPAPAVSSEDAGEFALSEKATRFPQYREITQPSGFVNTDGPITLEALVGKKVILLDIMTYSCINCQRTYPYLNGWYDKYKDAGLEIVGIHTPEFEFEKDIDNVRDAMKRFGIEFSIVLDNDFGTWNAYENRYWPRKFLIDIDGYVVYDHIGEGGYGETERTIQALLKERMERLGEEVELADDMLDPEGVEKPNPFRPRSPETYLGTLRNNQFGIIDDIKGEVVTFSRPEEIEADRVYLVGDWKFTGEFAEAASPGATIIYKYQAQKVFLVASSEEAVNADIRVDGEIVTDKAGVHVENGSVRFQNEQLYRLIEADTPGTGVLEIIIEEPGVRGFAFTFG